MKNRLFQILSLIIIAGILSTIFYLQPKTQFDGNFMKDGYSNMYIDHKNDVILQNIRKYTGADRVELYMYHNGTRGVTGIPFIKESLKTEILAAGNSSRKSSRTNVLINDNFYINDYLYKRLYIYIDVVSYRDIEHPREIVDTLINRGVKSYYAKHIYHGTTIAGYVVVEKSSGLMLLEKPKLDSLTLQIKEIESNVAQMKLESENSVRNDIEKNRLNIFIVFIVFFIITIVYFGSKKITKVSDQTMTRIAASHKTQMESIENIGAKLNKSLADNNEFFRQQFLVLLASHDKLNNKVNDFIEEKLNGNDD
jgi:hypothetical protein